MKETISASVAGIGFLFDRDAFQILDKYLSGLTSAYASNPDGEEIVADIEARIVEIILSRQSADAVVGRQVIEDITEQLGMPEPAPENINTSATAPDETGPFPRRLYRDMSGAKLGGVCNGIARYLDIDPVLVRVGMFIPIFLLILLASLGFNFFLGFLGSLFGSFSLLYIIMWIAVPAARSPRQRLEMQGKKITADQIEKEWSATAPKSQPYKRSTLARIFSFIGAVILFIIKFFLVVIGTALGIAALALVVGIIGLIFGRPWFFFLNFDTDINLFLGDVYISNGVFAAVILTLIAIPLIMLVYQMIRASFGGRNSRAFMWILTIIWLLSAVFTTVTILENTDQISKLRGGIYFRTGWQLPFEDNPLDTARGWELYEQNVQAYRDSLEHAQ